MDKLNSFPPLYHYTSQAGLLGMYKYKLWFSHINYLNDSEEFYYALNRIEETIIETYSRELLDDLKEVIPQRNKIYPVFIFSLSKRKDSLSQWRGYCPNGGYSILLNNDLLNSLIKNENLTIERCRYGEVEQKEFIKDRIFSDLLEKYSQERRERAELKSVSYLKKGVLPFPLISNILKYAPFIKHPKFEDEEEWRIVDNKYFYFKQPNPPSSSSHYQVPENKSYLTKLKFREGKSCIIPYLELELKDDGNNLSVFSEIIVGPTPNNTLSIEACKMLVNSEITKIYPSEIPYRNW